MVQNRGWVLTVASLQAFRESRVSGVDDVGTEVENPQILSSTLETSLGIGFARCSSSLHNWECCVCVRGWGFSIQCFLWPGY